MNTYEQELSRLNSVIKSMSDTIVSLTNKITSLESLYSKHSHDNLDSSRRLTATVPVKASSIELVSGRAIDWNSDGIDDYVNAPINIYDFGQASVTGVKNNASAIAMYVSGRNTSSEQIQFILNASASFSTQTVGTLYKDYDTSNNNAEQVQLQHGTYTNTGASQSFFHGLRTPSFVRTGTATGIIGANTLTDSSLGLTVNALAGSILSLYDSSLNLLESWDISSNTSTVITINGTFISGAGTYRYSVFTPIYNGSANYPWKRLYAVDDIRLWVGPSSGTQPIFIKHGTGSPEGVITANVGSLYLRRDGGASTTLYVKESGTGNTGWIAK